MAADAAQRFNFTFAELAPAPRLELVRSAATPVPEAAEIVLPRPRPRWMPRLLPVFPTSEPMLVEVRSPAAPAFGARLVAATGAVIATAGAEAGVLCAIWPGGFAAGSGSLRQVGSQPHLVVIPVELEAGSLEVAAELLRRQRAAGTLPVVLAVNGRAPTLERALGLEAVAGAATSVLRLPLASERDLRLAARGVAPGTGRRRSGRVWVGFACHLVRAYLEVLG